MTMPWGEDYIFQVPVGTMLDIGQFERLRVEAALNPPPGAAFANRVLADAVSLREWEAGRG